MVHYQQHSLEDYHLQILRYYGIKLSLSTGIVDLGLLIPSSFSSILINSGGHS